MPTDGHLIRLVISLCTNLSTALAAEGAEVSPERIAELAEPVAVRYATALELDDALPFDPNSLLLFLNSFSQGFLHVLIQAVLAQRRIYLEREHAYVSELDKLTERLAAANMTLECQRLERLAAAVRESETQRSDP